MTSDELISKYSYNHIAYKGCFGAAAQFSVTETDFNRLSRLAKTPPKNENLKYAEKAALLYGIPGLLLYIECHSNILSGKLNTGELLSQEAIQLLAKVSFAKQMLCEIKESKAIAAMDAILPGEQYSQDKFWVQRETALKSLITEGYDDTVTNDVNDIARCLVDACSSPANSNKPVNRF